MYALIDLSSGQGVVKKTARWSPLGFSGAGHPRVDGSGSIP
jgi:hypothetical protein